MKKLFMTLFLSLSLIACDSGVSNEDIANTVKKSMQEALRTNEAMKSYNLKVDSISVLKDATGNYKGYAQIEYNGVKHNVMTDIILDGENVGWNVEQAQWSFL